MTEAIPWTCPTCRAGPDDGAYCKACGERRLTAHDDTLGGLLHQWIESLVHIDGRIVRSCRELLTMPGELTAAYLTGRRQPYIAPFQLFLVMNLVFFVTQGLTGLSILSVPLQVHLDSGWYGAAAQRALQSHLAGTGQTLAEFEPHFEHLGQTIAKSLVIVMVPMLALCLAVLLRGARRSAPTHLLFATHFYGYMLLFLTLLFPVAAIALRLLGALGLQVSWSSADGMISVIEVAAVAWYLLGALPRVYRLQQWRSLLASAALAIVVVLLLRVYRAIQFGITLQLS